MSKKRSASMDDLADCVINSKELTKKFTDKGFDIGEDGISYKEAMMCMQIINATEGDLDAFKAVMSCCKKKRNPIDELLDSGGVIGELVKEE